MKKLLKEVKVGEKLTPVLESFSALQVCETLKINPNELEQMRIKNHILALPIPKKTNTNLSVKQIEYIYPAWQIEVGGIIEGLYSVLLAFKDENPYTINKILNHSIKEIDRQDIEQSISSWSFPKSFDYPSLKDAIMDGEYKQVASYINNWHKQKKCYETLNHQRRIFKAPKQLLQSCGIPPYYFKYLRQLHLTNNLQIHKF
jgi:hypothetical protein